MGNVFITQKSQNFMKREATQNLRPAGFCGFCEFCVKSPRPAGSALSADSA